MPFSSTQFLTSCRRATAHPSVRQIAARPLQTTYIRTLSTTSRLSEDGTPANKPTSDLPNASKGGKGDPQHATRKDGKDTLSGNAQAGMDAKGRGTGGSATEERDSAGGVESAKRDHPAAPDPAIGMQDERGGKGA